MPAERVAVIARRLLDDGHVRYEIDAWRTAIQLLAASERLADEPDGGKDG
jgi:hypothetical protein